ncbi:MAG: CsoS2 family carboxysome shell protein, partial [Thiohalocapsa sp.]
EYMGADIFREFCQTEPAPSAPKVRVSPTSHGNRITGNEVGRSNKVTGDEPGTCKQVTGTEYLSPNQYGAFCEPSPRGGSVVRPLPAPAKIGLAQTDGGKPVSGNLVGRAAAVTGDEHGADVRPTGTQYTAPSDIGQEIVPPKVGRSTTLAGGTVTGDRVGRSERVTGDEPGSCRMVTGDQYIDRSQYDACGINPQPEPPGTGLSTTNKGLRVSGTQTGRSQRVTGDEPGTCKAITGTPYAGLEQAADYCEPPRQREIQARTRQLAATPGPKLSGIQPGIDPKSGGRITGAAKGACEPLTGTPYVGADQFAAACGGGNGAEPGQADFPQLLENAAPWQGFSVTSPARQSSDSGNARSDAVTGTVYESSRHITGPFGMGSGKITGTEQFRFDHRRPMPELMKMAANAPATEQGDDADATVQVSRVTGEGQSAGQKVTGDDWERGDHVTGTEGASARRRNPTRPGPMGAMPPMDLKRNEETPKPITLVTGAGGSTERGSLVTYSGGARG